MSYSSSSGCSGCSKWKVVRYCGMDWMSYRQVWMVCGVSGPVEWAGKFKLGCVSV